MSERISERCHFETTKWQYSVRATIKAFWVRAHLVFLFSNTLTMTLLIPGPSHPFPTDPGSLPRPTKNRLSRPPDLGFSPAAKLLRGFTCRTKVANFWGRVWCKGVVQGVARALSGFYRMPAYFYHAVET